jgi:energy-coupling factor transporter ATP-binding protein EcfA2
MGNGADHRGQGSDGEARERRGHIQIILHIEKGDYVGIVGPNGGGKTTLVLALLWGSPHAGGSIRIMGQEIESFDQWEKVGYVSQFAINFDSQFPLTVKELVGLGRVNRRNMGRFRNKEDWTAVDEALRLMNISVVADMRIGMLCGGQRQRAFVAKSLVSQPELLVLDEPVTGSTRSPGGFFMQLANLNSEERAHHPDSIPRPRGGVLPHVAGPLRQPTGPTAAPSPRHDSRRRAEAGVRGAFPLRLPQESMQGGVRR